MQVDTRQLLSDSKFYESYSRFIPELNRYERWDESVSRVMNMHREYYKDKIDNSDELKQLIEFAEQKYKDKHALGAQRALQFGGEQLLKHPLKMFNCISSYADRPAFFGEILFVLLCGNGAGFSVQYQHVNKLPKLITRTKAPKVHTIDDSIEGWATALDVLMSSFFDEDGKHPEYRGRKIAFDLSQIRPKGAPISGGFKAPGPEPLRRALDRIEYILTGLTIKEKNNSKLRPIDVYDIVMHAADAVLSGGVRRSATICLFSPDDQLMLKAKTGKWFEENPQRARSNNSAVLVKDQITKQQFAELMQSIQQFGEPGFFMVDDDSLTTNPCCEIIMYPQIDGQSGWQGCNLTEINGSVCNSEQIFLDACKAGAILGTLQAGYTNFSFLNETTKKIFEREALLGVSITGWANNPETLFDKEILKKGANVVKQTNKQIAFLLGINPAARTTCVKPAGSTSVILKTASGIHPEHSPRYIRHVQFNKQTEVAKLLLKTNPVIVEESIWSANRSDFAISYPIIAKNCLYKADMIGVDHLEKIKLAQQYWVEEGTNIELCANKKAVHNVSNTILVDDWDAVAEYIFENKKYFCGISFLPLTGDKDYFQAPNTEVLTEQQIVKKYKVGGIMASGLIVDGLSLFDNIWNACYIANDHGKDLSQDDHNTTAKKDWIRRYHKFAENYFDGDIKQTEYCLKDVFLLHKWTKITQQIQDVDWSQLGRSAEIDIDTMGAAACAGGACEI